MILIFDFNFVEPVLCPPHRLLAFLHFWTQNLCLQMFLLLVHIALAGFFEFGTHLHLQLGPVFRLITLFFRLLTIVKFPGSVVVAYDSFKKLVLAVPSQVACS